MKTKIRLKNIQIYGWHGVGEKEKQTGQQFEIDVEITVLPISEIDADNINKTVNYCELYDNIVHLFSKNKYNLIETLANKIYVSIINNFDVEDCKVIIRKPDAPIDGKLDSVEVEVYNNG